MVTPGWHNIWAWLPYVTISLKFAAALIGFGVAVVIAFRRLPRRRAPRR
ncbi:hypothetical protein [Micromonospora sp. AMSO31t]|nr:hypothetical protein [Micromonospora sp. AMSO31t]